jgi:VPS62-like protein
MATDEELLRQWMPKVCYDSLEAFFVDHPLQMLVNPKNTLRRKPSGGNAGKQLAIAPIDLGWPNYPDAAKTKGEDGDRLSIDGRNYRDQYVALRKAHPELKNKLVARAVRDQGVLWLQYWLWYFYNDYQLAFNFGLHEGDWEMVQLRMAGEEPDRAVYAQHDQAEWRDWKDVMKSEDGRPLVFSGRGSHASYFEPGKYKTEAWYDISDGTRSAKETDLVILDDDNLPGWIQWQGQWGDTEPRIKGLHTPSPRGPIKQEKKWFHPTEWAKGAAKRKTPEKAPDASGIRVARVKDHVVLHYDFTDMGAGAPAVVVLNVNSPEVPDEPPRTFTFNVEDQRAGSIVTSIELVDGVDYEAKIATTSRDGEPTAPLERDLPANDDAPKTTVLSEIGEFFSGLEEKLTGVFGGRSKPGGP